MAADYYVSAIRKTGNKIEWLKAHAVRKDGKFSTTDYEKFSINAVVDLLQAGKTLKVITHDSGNSWTIGQEIDFFIRSHKDKTQNNNLDHLPEF